MREETRQNNIGTLNLIASYLTDEEWKIFEVFNLNFDGKTNILSDNKQSNKTKRKVTVEETKPLIANFFDTTEERMVNVFDLDVKSIKKELKEIENTEKIINYFKEKKQ